jgi:hypothetical protein
LHDLSEKGVKTQRESQSVDVKAGPMTTLQRKSMWLTAVQRTSKQSGARSKPMQTARTYGAMYWGVPTQPVMVDMG